MPVTAKLSRRFYERFGDELTNELVDWFNSVDATYQSDLRDLNESNFARSDAKLEQRAAGIEAKIDGLEARSDAKLAQRAAGIEAKIDGLEARSDARLEQRAAAIEAKIDGLEARSDAKLAQRAAGIEAKIDGVEAKLGATIHGVETRLEAKIDGFDAKMEQRFAEQREDLTKHLAAFESRITRWVVTLWTGTMLTMAGVIFAVLRSK